MGWGSIRKSITKPFKQLGKAIHWTDIRTPVVAAAAVAAAVYTGGASLTALAGTGAASSVAASGSIGAGVVSGMSAAGAAMTSAGAVGYGALAGGYMGFSAHQQNKALEAQKASDAATIEAANKASAAAGAPTALTSTSAQVDTTAYSAGAATAAKRRYSLSRTVNGSSLLGGFGSSTRRNTLG